MKRLKELKSQFITIKMNKEREIENGEQIKK